MGHEVIAKQEKHRGSIAHTNTGVIQQKAVMERERLGDTLIGPEHNATRDNFDHDGEAKKTTTTTTNSAGQGAPKGHNPRRLPAAKQTTTFGVSRGWRHV